MIALDQHKSLVALVMGAALLMVSLLALLFGTRGLTLPEIWQAVRAFDPANPDHVALLYIRAPRIPAALLVGAALGAAGTIMQSLTRNPLADPGLLGVNGGAAFGVCLGLWGLGLHEASLLIWPALIGAGLASLLVILLGDATNQSRSPTQLVLAGAAVAAICQAVIWAILTFSREALDIFRFWMVGGFRGVTFGSLLALWPFFLVGGCVAALSASLLNSLLLGDDAARALGVRVGMVRLSGLLAIILLAGSAVALAGPIAFVGLLVPHIARFLSGPDVRWLMLFSSLLGAGLTVSADLLSRILLPGREVEAGAMIAFIGGPTLVLIVRNYRAIAL